MGVINVDLCDDEVDGSMLMFTGTHDEEDVEDEVEDVDDVVDDEDKHDILLLVTFTFDGFTGEFIISLESIFKWFMSSAEYLWQNEWLLCKFMWFVSESWSVKSLRLFMLLGILLQMTFISFVLISWFGVTEDDEDEEHAEEEDEWDDVDEDLFRTFWTSCRMRPWPLLEQMLELAAEPELLPLIDFLALFFLKQKFIYFVGKYNFWFGTIRFSLLFWIILNDLKENHQN